MTKPNLFLIGEPKTGTSAIRAFLDLHDDITMSAIKGGGYFTTDYQEERKQYNPQKATEYDLSKEEYFKRFSGSARYAGDAPAHYAYSSVSAKNIYDHNPDTKIIYGVREPTELLASYFLQNKKNLFEDCQTLREALKIEQERKKGNLMSDEVSLPSILFYSERVQFSKHLKRYLDVFPQDQVYVYVYEEFKQNNQKIMDEIFDFLDLSSIVIPEKKYNVRRKVQHTTLRRILIGNSSYHNFLREITPLFLRKSFGKLIDLVTLKRASQKIKPNNRDLKLQFKDEVEKINDLLNQHEFIDTDLVSLWGYDDL